WRSAALAALGLPVADEAGAACAALAGAASAGASFLRNSQVKALPNAPSPGGSVRSVWLRVSRGEGVPPAQPARPAARITALNALLMPETLRGSVEIKRGRSIVSPTPWVTAP